MKIFIFLLLTSSMSWSQDLTPDEQRALINEVQNLKERVQKLENKDSGQGFKTRDYQDKTTFAEPPQASKGPAMTEDQKKEIMETLEKYKKAQEEQQKYLKELEDEG